MPRQYGLAVDGQTICRTLVTQDMGKGGWQAQRGHWFNARTAYYVLGSDRRGAMASTLESFAAEADARSFAARHGGRVPRFDAVRPAMVVLDGGVLRDERK